MSREIDIERMSEVLIKYAKWGIKYEQETACPLENQLGNDLCDDGSGDCIKCWEDAVAALKAKGVNG